MPEYLLTARPSCTARSSKPPPSRVRPRGLSPFGAREAREFGLQNPQRRADVIRLVGQGALASAGPPHPFDGSSRRTRVFVAHQLEQSPLQSHGVDDQRIARQRQTFTLGDHRFGIVGSAKQRQGGSEPAKRERFRSFVAATFNQGEASLAERERASERAEFELEHPEIAERDSEWRASPTGSRRFCALS